MVSALLIKHPANEGNPTCAGTSPPSKAAARESMSGIDIFSSTKIISPFGRVETERDYFIRKDIYIYADIYIYLWAAGLARAGPPWRLSEVRGSTFFERFET